ncbi:MAG: hypothetical protein HOH58_02745 [Opitutaceae bacterium]|nr:hypothetical protein [Opitutaceae bacterium]
MKFSISRFLALCILPFSTLTVNAVPPRVPPLVEPVTQEYLTGKIVWADVLSTEPNTTARFYGALFGWSSRTLAGDSGKYTVLSNETGPVVGIARGPDRKDGRPSSRWVPFFSHRSLNAAENAVASEGGRVLAGATAFPLRGTQLIAMDAEGAIFGLMDSSVGDPADGKAIEGSLFWANLFSESPDEAARFYRSVAGLDARSQGGASHVLVASGADRASISPIDVETSVTPTWVPFFLVTDLDRKIKIGIRLGAKLVVKPRTLNDGMRVVILVDSLGGVFALAQPSEK